MKRKTLRLFSAVLASCCVLTAGCAAVPAAPAAQSAPAAEEAPAEEPAAEEEAPAEESAEASVEGAEEAEAGTEAAAEAIEAEASEEAAAETGTEAAEEPEEASEEAASAGGNEMRDLTPAELIAEMNTGWNLGNSLDAYDGTGLDTETSWGNPATTKEMIDTISGRGFNVIRIPVTWGPHMGAAPDYTVDEEWMNRVQEVVDYAIDDGMFVILDSHHEEAWRILDDAHIEAVSAQHIALWTQIAERFKDYGDHLIFDGLNEPRVKDGPNEWNGGTSEGRACLTRLNQEFVDTVRATGGNNEKRLLLITSFASSAVIQTIGSLKIPEDDHIAVSIHAYTPYGFTYKVDADWALSEWDGSHNYEIDKVISDLKRIFLDKGIPVLITEYGAQNKDGNDEDVARWVTHYLEEAKENGIVCVWWDNGCYTDGNEQFAIFNRHDCTWYSEPVVDAIMAVYGK
ncbi:MAG: glycoside hydrolase family 5 protein [Lachnospiraceae bacterium]|nr:glycoside hydrolase family 5 protein [Lachnospiraceae bacterium]